jgi:hypothetical protein
LNASGLVTLNSNNDSITIGDNLTLGTVGTGESIIKQRNINALEFKSIKVSNNLSITTTTDEVRISGDEDIKKTTATSSGTTLTEVLFNNDRILTPPDETFFITVTAIGRRTNGVGTMAIKREALVDNTSGTVTIVSDEANSVNYNNNVSSNWELLLQTAPMLKIFVRGAAGQDINWAVKAEMLRVS